MKLEDLKPAQYNPRQISPEAIAGLKKSIRKFGDLSGIVWNKRTGNIVAGHQRLRSLKEEFNGKIAVSGNDILTPDGSRFPIRTVDWDEATERAANIAANNPHIAGEFTPELDAMLEEVKAWDGELFLDIRLDKLEKLKPRNGLTDAESIPSAHKVPITKPGDLWIMGNHRLLCGDATNEKDVNRLMNSDVPFIMVTDPPYGVQYDPAWRNDAAKKGLIKYSPSSVGEVSNDDRLDWTEAYKLFPGIVAYVWCASYFISDIMMGLRDSDFEIRSHLIWRKSNYTISRGHYHWQHEPCLYAARPKLGSSKWIGGRKQSTVWDITSNASREDKNEHSTQKPIECMERPIRNHGDANDIVYDPFLGSGTTIIAAERLGRKCIGLEIEPKYCDIIVNRWEKFTGQTARLA